MGWPAADLYLETTTNKTFPYSNSTAGTTKGGSGGNSTTGTQASGVAAFAPSALVALFAVGASVLLA
jgi:hypothetical protein